MKKLAEVICEKNTGNINAAIFFLGQAGLVIKTSSGALIAVDLYLSDCVERFDGYKRLMPKLLGADESVFDVIVATHAHLDHFDIDSIPVLMSNDKSLLLCAHDCKDECDKLKIPASRTRYIAPGDKYTFGDATITAVKCDHGKNTPHAVGLIIEISGKVIYITGDTALHTEYAKDLEKYDIDVMFAPINGAFGNMNEAESVEFCEAIKPKLVVPYHFWNFAEHGGDPALFMKIIKERLPSQKYLLMRPGECMEI